MIDKAMLPSLSKALVWLARHSAPNFNLFVDVGGWIYGDDIVKKVPNFQPGARYGGATYEDVADAMKTDPGERLALEAIGEWNWRVRARQGHSFEFQSCNFPLDVAECPFVYHGTKRGAARRILKAGNLSRMRRLCVHFKPSLDAIAPIYTHVIRVGTEGLPFNFEQTESNLHRGSVLCRGNEMGQIPLTERDVMLVRKDPSQPWCDANARQVSLEEALVFVNNK